MTANQPIASPSKTTRSRVTNGSSRFVQPVDGRTMEARRFRDVLGEIVSDLGGSDVLSEGQKQLARRAALMSVRCEVMEGDAVQGKDIDLEQFGRLTDRLGRAFQRLGLKRVARDVGPTDIHAYAAQKRREREAATA